MTSAIASIVLFFPLLASSTTASAGIPHENYELVGDNIDALVGLLNLTITFSELALQSMYDQNMVQVEQNLSVVRGLLMPAEQLLGEISDIAPSYSNLSNLLPPFASLSAQEDTFAVMETELLDARDTVVDSSLLQNLTGEAYIAAIDAIKRFNTLVTQMNRTIDDMLVSANQIIVLEVDDEKPFADNELIPLIERLRDLLALIEGEFSYIIENVIHWDRTLPFLILWLDSSTYYLGEQIRGGGYLYLNGSFAEDKSVKVLLDGGDLTTVTTGSEGRFSFSYQIPLDASWLGGHVVVASHVTPNGTLFSDPISIQISLLPTRIDLKAWPSQMEIVETLNISVSLTDIKGRPVSEAPCNLSIDSELLSFTTDDEGTFSYSRTGYELGYGTHLLQAAYDGELPYKGSSSKGVRIVVDIPTNITMDLFSPRVTLEQHIVGKGTLVANGTTPIADQTITMYIDGIEMANFTTDENGEFVFTIENSNLTTGAHVLRAALVHKDLVWRYSQDEEFFTVTSPKISKYPFFPWFPKWGRLFPGEGSITYLFIGQYAYFAWLLILTMIGLAVRIARFSRRRRMMNEPAPEPLIPALLRLEKEPVLSSAELSAKIEEIAASGHTPNESIIRYYRALMAFLSQKRRLDIRANMTHWEVARLMNTSGFPTGPVERITRLFERALYSGQLLDETDTVEMSSHLSRIVGTRSLGVPNAG